MSEKPVFSMVLLVVLMVALGVSINVHKVEAPYQIITIEADGSISPASANITTLDNVTYTFTADFNASIIIQRSNIVVDGDGWTLGGNNGAIVHGLNLTDVSNVTIRNLNVMGFGYGIYLQSSTLNNILNNNVTFNEGNIYLGDSYNNAITGNTMTNGAEAIQLHASSNNTISGNSMSYNYYGVWSRFDSAENVISGNNITHGNRGIFLDASPSNMMSGNRIAFVADGVYTNNSQSNIITGNSISTSNTAIYLRDWSPFNTITRNTLDNNTRGIQVQMSYSNIIVGNTITRNLQYGVLLFLGTSSTLVHNSFQGNTQHVRAYLPTVHVWDNGVEGNYWSNYTGADADHDGVGDTPHVIDANNTDHYPIMGTFHSFNTSVGEYVNIISNSTVTYFDYWETHERIIIQVRNATTDQTAGFCRISIPHNLTDPKFTWVSVYIDDGTVTPLLLNTTLYDNDTHRWIYVAYPHPYSLHEIVVIIPEFPSLLLLPLSMISTLLAVIVHRRRAHARRLM